MEDAINDEMDENGVADVVVGDCCCFSTSGLHHPLSGCKSDHLLAGECDR